MTRRTIGKWVATSLLAILLLLIAGYLAFVPSNQEPGYEFVSS